ncbi:MAG TPA: cytochrome c, partial [Azospira sp.]|nr:cytochrome c [Azospira sp.]
MPMRKPTLLLALALPLLLAACGEAEDTRPGQPVAHRRAAFQQILKAFEPMGIMLRENRYNADEFLKRA